VHKPFSVSMNFLKDVGNNFRWRVRGEMTDYCLYRLFGIWGEDKIADIIFLEVGFYGRIVRHFFCYDTGSISCISELLLSLSWSFKLLWSSMRFVVEVTTIDGGLPDSFGSLLLR
jgi:hypothetical protein